MKGYRGGFRWLAVPILLGTVMTGCPNPDPGSGTRVREGVGILDYYTIRAADDGTVISRDIAPEPRPREAITGDDYFQLKLEHIYIGDALGQDVGNVAIITQLEGVVPDGVQCAEIDVSDLEFNLNQRERGQMASRSCAFKHVVAINPVFDGSHITFDSAFITPPFRMGMRPIGLRFIIAQLNDYELARDLLSWAETMTNNLGQFGLDELTGWQSDVVNIGFTVANYILDYASTPDYVFEFETDFVPIETVGGVTTPQNIFMGGDFVIVGFPTPSEEEVEELGIFDLISGDYEDQLADYVTGGGTPEILGAMMANQRLVFDSGRLYHRGTSAEYRDGPYIVFKVVRQSRYPAELPVTLARLSREMERGYDGAEAARLARDAVLDLQDLSVVNETEGRYLLDLFEWFVDARALEAEVDEAAYDGVRPDPEDWALQIRDVPLGIGPDLALAGTLNQVQGSLDRLAERIYENYGRNPGMWQAECVALRDVTQGLADSYERLYPDVLYAFQILQTERAELQRDESRSSEEDSRLESLEAAEMWAGRQLNDLPDELDEPECPALRR